MENMDDRKIKTFREKTLEGAVHIIDLAFLSPRSPLLRVMVEFEGRFVWPSRARVNGPVVYSVPSSIPEHLCKLVEQAFDEIDIIRALTRV